jgi:hypothetical protein
MSARIAGMRPLSPPRCGTQSFCSDRHHSEPEGELPDHLVDSDRIAEITGSKKA